MLGVIPGLSETQLSNAQNEGELHYYPDLHLRLFRHYCDSYYQNLMSEQAKIYFIGRLENDLFTPVLLTVDFDEAASYMEAGEHVMEAALPDELCVWLERFLIYHYAPEAPKSAVVNGGKIMMEALDERKISIRKLFITLVPP